jgi:hypothetical protein
MTDEEQAEYAKESKAMPDAEPVTDLKDDCR